MDEKLKKLAMEYKAAFRYEKKKKLLDAVFFYDKKLEDFLGLLDLAKIGNFNLEFTKKVIDSFFEWQFDGSSLRALYNKVKGQVAESYFVGSIYRKNMTLKMLAHIYCYSQTQVDKDFCKVIQNIMLHSALDMEDFVTILCEKGLDKQTEERLISELKKHDSSMPFWIRTLDRSLPGSTLENSAKKIITQQIAKRSFKSLHELYDENSSKRAAAIILQVLADVAVTLEEANKVIYLAEENSKAYKIASSKKAEMLN